MNWYLQVLSKFAVLSGRARRTEFWMFTLISTIISLVLSALDSFFGNSPFSGPGSFSPISNLYSLAVFIPSIAVGVRRLQDTGRSGWWLLLMLIPVIGWIALIFFFIQDSEEGDNRFGPNPKQYAELP